MCRYEISTKKERKLCYDLVNIRLPDIVMMLSRPRIIRPPGVVHLEATDERLVVAIIVSD